MMYVRCSVITCFMLCNVLCDVMCCVWHDTNCPAQASRVSAWAMWAPWAQLQLWHFIWFRVSRYSIVYLFLVPTKNKPVNQIIARTLHNFLSKLLKSIMNKWSNELSPAGSETPQLVRQTLSYNSRNVLWPGLGGGVIIPSLLLHKLVSRWDKLYREKLSNDNDTVRKW